MIKGGIAPALFIFAMLNSMLTLTDRTVEAACLAREQVSRSFGDRVLEQ
jgi:hypothetical protein